MAPPRHASIDEARVAREAGVGPDAEPLGDARTKRLDEHVRLLNHRKHEIAALRLFQIERDRAAIAQQRRVLRRVAAAARPFDTHHVRAHIGQHHAAVGCRAEAGDLDDLDSGEGSH